MNDMKTAIETAAKAAAKSAAALPAAIEGADATVQAVSLLELQKVAAKLERLKKSAEAKKSK